MTDIRPRRSVLYMPGSNARALEKARTLAADALILDLEDAVAPEAKEAARAPGLRGGRRRRLRPPRDRRPHQCARHAWGEADLAAARGRRPTRSWCPRSGCPRSSSAVGLRLRRLGAPERTRVWAMIETPLAILRCQEHRPRRARRRHAARLLRHGHERPRQGDASPPRAGPRARCCPGLTAALRRRGRYGLDIIDGVYNALVRRGRASRPSASRAATSASTARP